MTEALRATAAPLAYLASAVMFFLGLKAAAKVRVAARAPRLALAAVALAVLGAALEAGALPPPRTVAAGLAGVVLGVVGASKLSLASAPARFAWIAGMGGGAGGILCIVALLAGHIGPGRALAAGLGAQLGLVSLVMGVWVGLRGSAAIRGTVAAALAAALAGGAMALVGFVTANIILLIGGGVGATAGLVLGRIAAGASDRTLLGVLFGGAQAAADAYGYTNVRSSAVDEAAVALETAKLVVVVPGQGMAAAGAQHAVKEAADLIEKRGARVVYAIIPSAGLVPGYMNIVLDQANVPHEALVDLEEAQRLVEESDVVLAVGANDVINHGAAGDAKNPLYGLSVLDLREARSVFVIKRSLRPGMEAGIKNPLFELPNTLMIFGDAKRVMQSLVAELKGGGQAH
jgi:NAD(P) transhydrogenase subunit beta